MAVDGQGPQTGRAQTQLQKEEAVALAFKVERARDLIQNSADLQARAVEESGFDRIIADEWGLSSGMRLHVLQPARQFLSEWRKARSGFDRQIQPHMADIKAVEALQEQLEQAIRERDEAIDSEERKLNADGRYADIAKHYREAETRYNGFRERHAMRAANMFGNSLLYWFFMLLIGVAEWQINYDIFFNFFAKRGPVAAGTTVILGLLLAFAAHGHGEIFKQWTYRFGPDRDDHQRFGSWRMFGLATLGLLIVLGAAGGSRYSNALSMISSTTVVDITGGSAGVNAGVDPLRDVLLSLLSNLGAWVVGVFIAYMAHDPDPDYMDATAQFRSTQARYNRARQPITRQLKVIEARFKKSIDDKHTAAASRRAAVSEQIDMLHRVDKHAQAVVAATAVAVSQNAETYRDILCGYAAKRNIMIHLGNGSTARAVSPYEYRAMSLKIDSDLMETLQ
jgi:hypothetical protein